MLQAARRCGAKLCCSTPLRLYPYFCNVVAVGAGGGSCLLQGKVARISFGADVVEGQIVVSSL